MMNASELRKITDWLIDGARSAGIGGGNRLDFTCIGPAVNLAARLEKIAGKLDRTVVASAGFAGICAGGWDDLGEFPIAGFSKAERVYGLLDETNAELGRAIPATGSHLILRSAPARVSKDGRES